MINTSFAFQPWPKIPRHSKEYMIITEKIDGTNAQIHILEDGRMKAASRTRYITPEDDNFGFAVWVKKNEQELAKLGPGRHYGEWYGIGIQREYGLSERKFALFNVQRWNKNNPNTPTCCSVVPCLAAGTIGDIKLIQHSILSLKETGSILEPGFMKPEGIIIHHVISKISYKILCENDDKHKGELNIEDTSSNT